MEDNFRVRLDKAFGALGGDTASSAGVSSSLWCLTDEEIERRVWNRSKEVDGAGDRDVESEQAVVRDHLESDLQELSDYEEEDGENIDGETKKVRRNNRSSSQPDVDEYLDIQSSIGRDCTLDYEEEEDAYDKMAIGTQRKGDRIYMRDVKSTDYGIDECSAYDELPNSFHAVVKDPRANHMAAKMRLKEDAEAAGNFDSLQLLNNPATPNTQASDLKNSEVAGYNPKPILKKRENLSESRAHKRVRFTIDLKSSTQANEDKSSELVQDCSQFSSGVPDCLRNPSKYTQYTFDSSGDTNGQSKVKEYTDLVQYVRERMTDSSVENAPTESPKSITFMPKRKPDNSSSSMERSESQHATQDDHQQKGWSIGVTAEDTQESEITEMDEDISRVTGDKGCNFHKQSRQYRTRSNGNDDTP